MSHGNGDARMVKLAELKALAQGAGLEVREAGP
jgi:hypothetical protein